MKTVTNILAAQSVPNAIRIVCNAGKYDVYVSGDTLPVIVQESSTVPASVTPRQIRLALNATGLRSTVEAAVAAGSQDLKDWWEYALEIDRNNPLIVAMAAQLNITADVVDDLFELAATL